ncbi:hypothetical protein RCS94_01710 [Orbaceae bacterium ac157xtp]
MKNYKIFKHPDGKMEAVKQGWSWPGFFFWFIWGFFHKLWKLACILYGIRFFIFVISCLIIYYFNISYFHKQTINVAKILYLAIMIDGLTLFLSFFVSLYIGARGNSFREKNLIATGYKLIGSFLATNPDMAIAESKKAEKGQVTNYM